MCGQSFLLDLYLTKANKGCADSKMQMEQGGSEMSLCEEAGSSVFGSHVLFVSVVCVLPQLTKSCEGKSAD